MKINVIVLDDTPEFLNALSDQLQKHNSINVIGRARNTEEAWLLIKTYRPDGVVLDIKIIGEGETAGLKLGKRIIDEFPINERPWIVFLTNYDIPDLHAVINTIHPEFVYILKTTENNTLITDKSWPNMQNDIDDLLRKTKPNQKPEKITTPDKISFSIMPFDILYIRGCVEGEPRNSTEITLKTGERYFAVSTTLNYFHEAFKKYGIIRIHKRYIINTNCIFAIKRSSIRTNPRAYVALLKKEFSSLHMAGHFQIGPDYLDDFLKHRIDLVPSHWKLKYKSE